jgi:hypothetical protein
MSIIKRVLVTFLYSLREVSLRSVGPFPALIVCLRGYKIEPNQTMQLIGSHYR